MPTLRKLTSEELQHLEDNGQDTSGMSSQQFNVYTPEEIQAMNDKRQQEQQGAVKGGLLPTLKSHAGSLLGGGLGATGGGVALPALASVALGTVLAPEVTIPLAIAGMVGGSFVGSGAGNAIQHKVVEPTIGMTPQDIDAEQQRAENARELFPKTSIATDVIGGMVAGGGKPSLRAPVYAAKGIVKGLAEEGLDVKALAGGSNPVYKHAIQNIVTGGALNTTINAGVQLATTGKIDPTELAISSIGGTLFSEPSALGRKLNPEWKPLGKAQVERPSVEENIAPDGTSIADVEAYKKIAQRQTDEINKENQSYIKQRDTIARLQEDQYNREVAEQQQKDQTAAQWRDQNWLSKGQDGTTPLIADELVKQEYIKRNKVNLKTVPQAEQRALAKQQNERLGNTPVEEMRQDLYDKDAPLRDPVGWQQEQAQRQQDQQAQVDRMFAIQEEQRAMAARQQEEQQNAQQRQQDFPQARMEQQGQQIQEAEAQRPPPSQGQPLTENQRRIINPEALRQQMAGGGLSKPREGGQLFQEAEQQQSPTIDRNRMSPGEMDRLLAEAGKAATTVGNVQGDLRTPSGQQARGVSYDPAEVGRRLIGMAREHATSDTGYHELVHTMLRDLDRSADPRHQELAQSIRRTFGGEEPAATHIGEKYQQTVEEAATKGLPNRIARYFKDLWSATKINVGEGSPEDVSANLIRRMRQRSGEQDSTIAGQVKPTPDVNTGSMFQESRLPLTQAAIERIPSDIKTDDGRRVADGLHKTLVERQNLLGKFWNPIGLAGKKMDEASIARVRDVLLKEVNDKSFYRNTLRTAEERSLYDVIRKSLLESAQLRQHYGEPVYRNGKPTPAGIDPYYYPTTTEPKVADIFRQNTNTAEIDRLSKDFIDQQTKHGISLKDAQQELKDRINTFQGSVKNSGSNETFYNANRKAQGIPLPESWQRQDMMRNLEAYHRRAAVDIAYYHNVEMDHKTMAALGYTKDPWHNPINEPTVTNIAGNDSVRAVTNTLKGEHMGVAERTAHAAESFATVTMLGPTTELHKTLSSFTQVAASFSDNPVEAAKVITAGIKGIGNAWTKVYDTGYVQMDAKKAGDFLNTHLTTAERMNGFNKVVRQIYTLNGLTEHFTKSFLHAAGEYLIPAKVEAANNGNKQALALLNKLDPDYTPGMSYAGDGLQRMASEFANLVHGTKDARTLPAWMLHDNEISAFFKLSSWNIAQTNNFMRHVVTPARSGNYAPLLMSLFGTAVGGYLIKTLREDLTAKKSGIPSLTEIFNSERGWSQNKAALAYNWMAASSYAGFAGILSTVARLPFDRAFKNIPQGATFPLDELVGNTATIFSNAAEAVFNDPNVSLVDVAGRSLYDFAKNNIQLARITFNHMADAGLIDSEAYKKGLSDKMGDVRRWKMVEGLPFESQGETSGNPYMNLGQKQFKREQDIGQAAREVGPLIQNIIKTYGANPEVMMQKFKSLKQNSYESMPSMDDTPLAFMRYLRFLRQTKGDDVATQTMQDYLKHRMVNEVKSGMVP